MVMTMSVMISRHAYSAAITRSGARSVTQFTTRLIDDLQAAPETETAHDRGDNHIRPVCAGAEHAHGGQHHGGIAKRVIARANPDRAHIRIACAEPIEHQSDATIGDERGKTHNAHDLGARQGAITMCHAVLPKTQRAKAIMVPPLATAARARQVSAMPATPRLMA